MTPDFGSGPAGGATAPKVVGRSFVSVIVPLSLGESDYGSVRQKMVEGVSKGWTLSDHLRPLLIRHLGDQMASTIERGPAELLSWWFCTTGTHHSWSGLLRLGAGGLPHFRVTRTDLALFDMGLGFLVVSLEPASDDATAWEDVLHHLRFTEGRRTPQVERNGDEVPWSSVVDDILASTGGLLLARRDPAYGYFGVILQSKSDASSTLEHQIRFRRMFPSERVVVSGYVGDDLWAPPLAYGADMDFHFSMDGGGFLAVDPPDTEFFRTVLLGHLQRGYLLAFIFACAQRIALLDLSARLIKAHSMGPEYSLNHRVADLAVLQRDLVRVVARSRFAQVLPDQNRHTVYRRWVETFELHELEIEVSNEVAAVHAQVSLDLEELRAHAALTATQSAERVERGLAIIGVGFACGSLVAAVLGVNIRDLTLGKGMDLEAVLWLLGAFVVLGSVSGWLMTRPKKSIRSESSGLQS